MVHSCNYNVIMNLLLKQQQQQTSQSLVLDVSTCAYLHLLPFLIIFDLLCKGEDPGH